MTQHPARETLKTDKLIADTVVTVADSRKEGQPITTQL